MSTPNGTMTDSDSKQQDMFPNHSPIDSTMRDADADAGADMDTGFHPQTVLFHNTFTQDITRPSNRAQEDVSESQSRSRLSTTASITTTAILKSRRRSRPPTLVTLPAELVLTIASHLDYPDVLSLRQSHVGISGVLSRHSTTHHRISWVLSRAYLGLPIPNNTRLSFKTDALFLSNREVQRILAARLNHGECLSQSPDLLPARQLARTRLGQRKGNNLCFVGGTGPCPAVLARRRLEKKRKRYPMTTTTQQKSFVPKTLLVFGHLVALAVEGGRQIREQALDWRRWVDILGCPLLLLACRYLTNVNANDDDNARAVKALVVFNGGSNLPLLFKRWWKVAVLSCLVLSWMVYRVQSLFFS
ncbi:uncharacterized protein PV06_10262 [Exophiala oligosperma]|uniref:F-box domain-containing protein n=2 Tax=Chaetothyriales TaxID=34395 RepID=A0A0D2AB96_9EURO|nr:uncharacterized protein PV06_10262 [Exophiala oligosperma]KAJ9623763.1 hypothetical protein H2204_011055 [Knufia peltigerae]KIW37621.1 hypothetical protein PV06_10262 [Exophiala oligosperma]